MNCFFTDCTPAFKKAADEIEEQTGILVNSLAQFDPARAAEYEAWKKENRSEKGIPNRFLRRCWTIAGTEDFAKPKRLDLEEAAEELERVRKLVLARGLAVRAA